MSFLRQSLLWVTVFLGASVLTSCDDPAPVLAIDAVPGSTGTFSSSSSYSMAVLNSKLYFGGRTASSSLFNPLIYDLSTVTQIKVLNGGSSSNPSDFVTYGSKVYFAATDSGGRQLYETTGTGPSTVKAANLGSSDPLVAGLVVIGSYLYFSADKDSDDVQLFRFDGSTALKIVLRSGSSSSPKYMTSFSSRVYFQADSGSTYGVELGWYNPSNGQIGWIDIRSGDKDGNPSELCTFGSRLYFQARDSSGDDYELYYFDGSSVGSFDIYSGGTGSYPKNLIVYNSVLYFQATTSSAGSELFKYTGSGSPSLAANIQAGSSSSSPSDFAVFEGLLYFRAEGTSSQGRELWQFDGSTASLVMDIYSGSSDSNPAGFTVFGSDLYFSAQTSAHGYELWKLVPSASPSVTPSRSPTISVTASRTPTISVTSSRSRSSSSTSSITLTPSKSLSPTRSVTPSVSVTSSRSLTRTPTASISVTSSISLTSSPSKTSSATPSISLTPSISRSPSRSRTPTFSVTPSVTSTATTTATRTPSVTPTFSPTPSVTATSTRTATPSVSPTPCPFGHYCPGSDPSAAVLCPVGSYCTRGVTGPTVCPEGVYGETQGLQTSACTAPCNPGFYCPSNSTSMTPCPAGVFGSTPGLKNDSCSGLCAAGYYCQQGSLSSTANPCGLVTRYCPPGSPLFKVVDRGYYTTGGTETTRETQTICPQGSFCSGNGYAQPCPAGLYGSEFGLTNETCTGSCSAGYYCPAGSKSPTSVACGSAAVYCKANASEPTPVTAGYYSIPLSVSELYRTDQASCEPGSFCVDGVKFLCAAGRWSADRGLSTNCTNLCDAGFYCQQGSTFSNPQTCGGAAFYCPAGSGSPMNVLPGNYSTGGPSEIDTMRTDTAPCPFGSNYCLGDGLSRTCPAGVYGNASGLATSLCSGRCSPGFFCPPNSTSPEQEPCGDATLFCPGGTTARVPVSLGYYSTPESGSVSQRSGQLVCNPGHFCISGIRYGCSPGTYSTSTQLFTPCTTPCEPGYYCLLGTASPTLQCSSPTTYCPRGSAEPENVTEGYFAVPPAPYFQQRLCPEGSYCVGGVRYNCPAGRFGNVSGETNSSCSGVCPAGRYCAAGSVTWVDCGGSEYFCPEGTPTKHTVPLGYYSTPLSVPYTQRYTMTQCPAGSYCINGNSTLCVAGRYGGFVGMSARDCTGPCVAGYYCPAGSTSGTEHACGSPDRYCPPSSGVYIVAEDGEYTIGGTEDGRTRTDVMLCEPGSYCVGGMKSPCPPGRYGCSGHESNPLCSGPCDAGYYCTAGSDSKQQFACGSGFPLAPASVYCLSNSSGPTLCGPGNYTYGGLTAASMVNEKVCEKGSYCSLGVMAPCPIGRFGNERGLTSEECSGDCLDGCYCKQGSEVSCPEPCPQGYVCAGGSASPCPAGTFNDDFGAKLLSDCEQCPADTYNPESGSISNESCVACVAPEGSLPGSRACWPGIVSVVASNPPPLVVGLSAGDIVSITFSRATNTPDVSTMANIDKLVLFSTRIASSMSASWINGGTTLLLRVLSTDGITSQKDLYEIGTLNVTLLQGGDLRDSHGHSFPHPDEVASVMGTWGVPSPPKIRQVTAYDSGKQVGLGSGDKVVILFDQETFPVPLTSHSDVQRVLKFVPNIGVSFTGRWLSRYEAEVVVGTAVANAGTLVGALVGSLRVEVLASGNVVSFNGQSQASNDSSVVMFGSWGDAPTATAHQKSSTALRVQLMPPTVTPFAYTIVGYVVQWVPVNVSFSSLTSSSSTMSWTNLSAVAVSTDPPGSPWVRVATVTTGSSAFVIEQNGSYSGAIVVFVTDPMFSPSVDIPGLNSTIKYSLRVACNNFGDVLGPFVPTQPSVLSPLRASIVSVHVAGSSELFPAGGQQLVITGKNLGSVGDHVDVEYTNGVYVLSLTSGCVVVTEQSRVTCVTVPGVGRGYVFRIRVGSDWSEYSGVESALSFSAPIVMGFSGAGAEIGASTMGGEVVKLRGVHFGPASVYPRALGAVTYTPIGTDYLFTATSCNVTQDDVEITCLTGPGVGSALSWRVVVANLSSSAPLTKYASPKISDISLLGSSVPKVAEGVGKLVLTGLSSSGGDVLVVKGENLGPLSPQLPTYLIGTPVMISQWLSVGSTGDVVSSRIDGSTTLTVPCVVSVDHVELWCTTPPHVGMYEWLVRVADTPSAYSDIQTRVNAPIVSAVSVSTIPTTGGQLMSFVGSGFGHMSADVALYWLFNGTLTRIRSEEIIVSQTVMTFRSPPGQGTEGVTFGMGVGDQVATFVPPSLATIQFQRPSISTYDFASTDLQDIRCDSQNMLVAGSYELIIIGTNFGNGNGVVVQLGPEFPVILRTSMNGTSSSMSTTDFIIVTSKYCTGSVIVTVDGLASDSSPFSVMSILLPPVVSSLSPGTGPTRGGTLVTLVGSRFGTVNSTTVALIRGTSNGDVIAGEPPLPCTFSGGGFVNTTLMACLTPPGVGSYYFVQVTVNKVPGTLFRQWRYDPPSISAVTPTVLSSGGRDVLTISGVNFGGSRVASSAVWAGPYGCSVLSWSDSVIMCESVAGVGKNLSVVVTVVDQTSPVTSKAVVEYVPPSVTSVTPLTIHTPGGDMICVSGSSLDGVSLQVWLTRTPPERLSVASSVVSQDPSARVCTSPSVSSSTSVCCVSPEGAGSLWYVTVVRQDDRVPGTPVRMVSRENVTVSYVPPVVTSFATYSPRNMDEVTKQFRVTVGGFLLVVKGTDFSSSPVVTVGGLSCVQSGSVYVGASHTEVACVVPYAVVDKPTTVRVHAGDLHSDPGLCPDSCFLEFAPPSINLIQPNVISAVEAATNTSTPTQRAFTINGRNFGVVPPLSELADSDSAVSMTHQAWVGGYPCVVDWMSDTTLNCRLSMALPVNTYDVVVRVRNLSSEVNVASHVQTLCPQDYYGLTNQTCKRCPTGAKCAGGFQLPQALPGYYPESLELFSSCYPAEACVGNSQNPCADGYAGIRCSGCALKHYRLQQQCKACPNTAWLLIPLVVIGVLVVMGVMVWLSKRRINLAGLSIGVDFLQMLAMFGTYSFKWPSEIRAIYNAFSFANFNLELVAPECTVAVSYSMKWAAVQALPLVLIFGICVLTFGFQCWTRTNRVVFSSVCCKRAVASCVRRCRLGSRAQKKLMKFGLVEEAEGVAKTGVFAVSTTLDTGIGLAITGLYYMYLVVVRNSFGPFRCTLNSNGVSVLSIEPSIVCNQPGGTHEKMIPWAMTCLILYGVGIPILFAVLLVRNRRAIVADQTLRVRGEGDIKDTNPDFNTRRRFRKLYEDFQPNRVGWKVLLILRKFLLASIAIMCAGNTELQAALTILVLFGAYVLHVNFKPFAPVASVSRELIKLVRPRRGAVIGQRNPDTHKQLTREEDGLPVFASPIVMSSAEQRRQRFAGARNSVTPKPTPEQLAAATLARSRWISFAIDYNSMEASFLVCATLILMGGLIFTSSAFPEGSVGYRALSIMISGMIVGCVVMFGVILVFEVIRAVKFAGLHRTSRQVEAQAVMTKSMRGGALLVAAPVSSQPANGQKPPRNEGSVSATRMFGSRRLSSVKMHVVNPLHAAGNMARLGQQPSVKSWGEELFTPPPPPVAASSAASRRA